MSDISTDPAELTGAALSALRDVRLRLSLLNRQMGQQVGLNDVDLDCLDILYRHGPHTPGALARRLGLHLATMTGILDRLERGGWTLRERTSTDRRSVTVRADPEQSQRVAALYTGMQEKLQALCAAYSEADLRLVADFLTRASRVGVEH